MRLLSSIVLLFVASGLSAAEDNLAGIKSPPLVDPVSAGSIFQLILTLLLIVGLILFAAWFFRRMGNFGVTGSQTIRYLGGISVGQRERIVLIEVGETQLLIGVAPGRVEKLHKLDVPIKIDATSSSAPFAQKLAELMNKSGRSS